MANSPSHRFGQIIGDLLEEIILPQLQEYCDSRGLYLDKKGKRLTRKGSKVTWQDKFANTHDLDFVIESGGSDDTIGRPVAFIEAAWRRYTKHSRAKAQEIQGAVLPISEKHHWDKPFLGAILAGVFTKKSLTQMESCGFETVLMPYDTVVGAFASVGIDINFDEKTADTDFSRAVNEFEALSPSDRVALKAHLASANGKELGNFFQALKKAIDRKISAVIVLPTYGSEHAFEDLNEAIEFVENFDSSSSESGTFRKFEVIVRYTNGDRVEATFEDQSSTIGFLNYIESTAH